MAASTSTPWMPSPTTFPPPMQPAGYYQGSAAGTGAGAGAVPVPQQGSGGGSIGAFFAVLAAVLVLTMLSCVFGRVCREQAEGPDERYDCARLARRWCWWGASRRIVRRREAKPPPVVEVPAAVPPPEP